MTQIVPVSPQYTAVFTIRYVLSFRFQLIELLNMAAQTNEVWAVLTEPFLRHLRFMIWRTEI